MSEDDNVDFVNNNIEDDLTIDDYQEDPVPGLTSRSGSLCGSEYSAGSLIDELESLGVRLSDCADVLSYTPDPGESAVQEAKLLPNGAVKFTDYSKHYTPQISGAYKNYLMIVPDSK